VLAGLQLSQQLIHGLPISVSFAMNVSVHLSCNITMRCRKSCLGCLALTPRAFDPCQGGEQRLARGRKELPSNSGKGRRLFAFFPVEDSGPISSSASTPIPLNSGVETLLLRLSGAERHFRQHRSVYWSWKMPKLESCLPLVRRSHPIASK
jgi:hypothetical protein